MHRRAILLLAGLLALAIALVASALRSDSPAIAAVDRSALDEFVPIERDTSAISMIERAPLITGNGYYSAPIGSNFVFAYRAKQRYGIRSTANARIADGAGGSDFDLELTLSIAIRARDSRRIRTELRFSDFSLRGQGATATPRAVAIHEQYCRAADRPVELLLGVDGAILGYRFDDNLDVEQRNFVRSVLAPLAFTVPPTARDADGHDAWEVREADATGIFVASYQAAAHESGLAVDRSKSKYVQLGDGSQEQLDNEISGGARAILSREHGWLIGARVVEAAHLRTPHRVEVSFSLDAHLELRDFTLGSDTQRESEIGGDWSAPIGDPVTNTAEQRQRLIAARLGNDVSLDRLVDALRAALTTEGYDSKAVYLAWNEIGHLLELRPEAARRVGEIIAGGASTGEEAGLLVTALGLAGNDECQDVLVDLVGPGTSSSELREVAANSLQQVVEPTPRAITAAYENFTSAASFGRVERASLLAFGTMAGRTAKAKAASDRQFLDDLFALESRLTNPDELVLWLDALGNAGSERAIEPVRRYSMHAQAAVRQAAIEALRFVPNQQSVDLLAERHGQEPEAEVRRSIVEALVAHQTPTADRFLRYLAVEDTAPSVRIRAIQALNRVGYREFIDRLTHTEQDPDVLRVIRRILAR